MTTRDRDAAGVPEPADADWSNAWSAMSAAMANVPDPAVIARMANEFFSALPGAPASAATSSGVPDVPSAARARPYAARPTAPPFTTSIPLGGLPLDAGALGGAARLTGLPSEFAPFAGVPTDADLRGLPALMSDVAALVPGATASPSLASLASLPGSSFYFLEEAQAANHSAPAPREGGAPQAANYPASAQRFNGASPPANYPASTPRIESYAFRPDLVPSLKLAARQFDVQSVRRDFPILEERVHGRPLIWLDNAATTQKPRSVIERISHFYEHENSNIHRAAHTLAARSTDAYEGARESVRGFLNAPSTREIVFVRGATEAINLVAQSFGRRHIERDDEIVITWLEHHSNIVPWQLLCAEKGARLRVAPIDDQGQILLNEYEKLLGPRTRLVSLTQVSNALGTVTPVQEMVQMAHRHGARVLVDGAQAVSHLQVDVQALDCDFYAFSGHKVFGPTGVGVLYGKADALDAMPPWQGGGNMIADVTFEKTVYHPAPARFEAGTGNIADAVGLGAALDYLSAIGLDNVTRYEHDLLVYATDALSRIPGLRLVGTAREKAGVLSFVLDGFRSEEVGAALDRHGIAVRSGHHCAQPALRRYGLESSVRPSLALYNTCDEIDALVEAIVRIQSEGRTSPR